MEIGKNIRAARKAVGLTQEELAQRLNVPFQSVSQWERGVRKPKIESLRRIAEAIGTTVDALLNAAQKFTAAGVEERAYILAFAGGACFEEEVCCRQLRSLWTAYCLHNGLDVDTAQYDGDLLTVWQKVAQQSASNHWNDLDSFDLYMGENLC